MKIKKILLAGILLPLISSAQTIEERLISIENKMDDFELTNALDKMSFSGSFMNQYESFYEANQDIGTYDALQSIGGGDPDQGQDSQISAFTMRVALNFDVEVSNSLKFFTTVGMSKFWNMSGRTTRTGGDNDNFKSLGGGYSMIDSGAHFDVAYLLYQKSQSPWAFALGRMTTNDGPPLNQLDGLGRSGTYPVMSYNVILDGAAVIYDFKSIMPKEHDLKLRVFYTPFMNVDLRDKGSNKVDAAAGGTEGVKTDSNMVTFLTEYKIASFSWLKSLDLYHSYYTFDRFYDEARQNPLKTGVEYEGAISNTVYIGLKGIAGSGLNLSYTYSEFLVRGDQISETGSYNSLINMNYKFDNSFNPGHIFGAEVINNDDVRVPTDATTMHINGFYNLVNGQGTHVYYSAPIGRSSIMRLGVMSYTQGESDTFKRDVESSASSTYLRWKVFF